MFKCFTSLFLLLFFCTVSFAQLTGTKTIPGDYASMALAVADLNTNGVGAGGVTFNISAGYAETGNHTITATGTAANPIVFQKNGAGANPVFTAGTGTGWDAVFKLVGSDYITFDGLTVQENTANSSGGWVEKTEFGFAFFKVDYTNGCQHNTIKNCSISLDRNFYISDPSPAVHYSTAIYMYNANAGHNWINQESTASGTHSYNIIQNNTIFDVGQGVFIYGYHQAPSSMAVVDKENEVKDNNITYGGNSIAEGIRLQYTANNTISGNTINTNPAHQAGAHAITYNPHGRSGCLITNNTIQLNGTSVLGSQHAIQVYGGGGTLLADPLWNTITITNNTILPSNTNYDYYGIECISGGPDFEKIENNTINLSNNAATNSGEAHGIWVGNWWDVATTVSIKNNLIQGHASSLTNFYGIYTADNTDLLTIENNKVINNSSSIYQGITLSGSSGSVVKNNLIASSASNTHYTYIGLQVNDNGSSAYNNYIGCRAQYSASAVAYGINLAGPINGVLPYKILHNTVYIDGNPSSVNTVSAFNINNSQNVDARNNIFYNAMLPGTFGNNYLSAFSNAQLITNSNFLSRNNLFYAGTPSATNPIYRSADGVFQKFIDYKLKVCAKDVNSVTGTLSFLSLDYTNANYLHIDPATASLANNNGMATPEVTVDFDNDARNATTPDIGADEFNGITQSPDAMVSTPVLWLKADAGVFSDAGITAATNGQTVQQWNDQTCNGYNVTQTTAANKPTYILNAANGKPTVRFSGAQLMQTINQINWNASTAVDVFIVCKNANANAMLLESSPDVNANNGTFYLVDNYTDNANGISAALKGSAGGLRIFKNTNGFIPCTKIYQTTYEMDIAGATAINLKLNNVAMPDNTGYNVGTPSGSFSNHNLYIGNRAAGGYPLDGNIYEVIIYDRKLTSTEAGAVYDYLYNKYFTGINLVNFSSLPASTVASNSVNEDANWKHTYNSTDNTKLIVSVKDNCLDLGTINSTVYTDATATLNGGQYTMRRHYAIKPTLDPAGTKRVRIYYTNADFADLQTKVPTLTSASQLVVTKYSGTNEDGTWGNGTGTLSFIASSQITTGTVLGVNYLEFDVTGFSEFWIHAGNTILPLEFLSFTAQKCNGHQVCLSWKTANEQNVSHFETERSINGRDFVYQERVNARNESLNYYSTADKAINPANTSTIFYRVKQVDNDGKTTYSSIAVVQLNGSEVKVFPTVFKTSFTVMNEFSGAEIQLFSADGRLLHHQRLIKGVNEIIPVRSSAAQLFYRIISNGETKASGKLIRE